ncbi:hypothetical protein AAC387_Pa03g1663 [Persea americana]
MGGFLYKWYQEEALMEGKKTTTSILPLAIDLREIERWRSKEQEGLKKNSRAGLGFLVLKEVARRGREGKDSSLYRERLWVPQLKNPIELVHRSTGFGRIRRRRKN